MSKNKLKKVLYVILWSIIYIVFFIALLFSGYGLRRFFDDIKDKDNSNIVLNDDNNLYKMVNNTYSQGEPLFFSSFFEDYVDFSSKSFVGGPFAEGTGYYQCFSISSDYINSYLNLDTDLDDYNPYIRVTTQYQLEYLGDDVSSINGMLINIRGFCFASNAQFTGVQSYDDLYDEYNPTFLFKYIVDTSIMHDEYNCFSVQWLFDLKPYLNTSNQLPNDLYFNFSLLKSCSEETDTYNIFPIDSRWVLADMIYSNNYSYGNQVDVLKNQNSNLQSDNSRLQNELTQLQTSYNSLDYNYTTLLGQYNTLLNQTDYSFSELFWSLSAVPFGLLTSAFNVQVMGVNLRGIISGLFTAALLIWLFKKFFK